MNPQTSNMDSGELEHRLRSMILENSSAVAGNSTPGFHAPQNHSAGAMPVSQQQQVLQNHPRDQRGNRHGRPSRRSRGHTNHPPSAQDPMTMSWNNGSHLQANAVRGHPMQRGMPRGKRHENYGTQQRWGPRQMAPQPLIDQQAQWQYLEQLAINEMSQLEISQEELASKERFRAYLDSTLKDLVIREYSDNPPDVGLACFGSAASGFGMPGSDMDLALVSRTADSDIFRLFEKRLLDLGHGAHLLTRTRVPIIKICELPTPELLTALREERQKWDDKTPEERELHDHPARSANEQPANNGPGETNIPNDASQVTRKSSAYGAQALKKNTTQVASGDDTTQWADGEPLELGSEAGITQNTGSTNDHSKEGNGTAQPSSTQNESLADTNDPSLSAKAAPRPPRLQKPWYREKQLGPLDFPKEGVGVQCDINFANPLGLHNTLLLRCYSYCDPRVRLMVLFIKAWASRRKINSARNGTLSSYGYVLMILHFLVNVAQPPVCPNLQFIRKSQGPPDASDENSVCDGWDVRFWRNEAEIQRLAASGMLTRNREPLGMLLRNFFEYYANQGQQSGLAPGTLGFSWTQSVLSLRTEGGILSKQAKGWTGAKVTIQDNVEVRHRYLFAIEDPFELDHNVARPVTHNGIVAIRDEFRRVWGILGQVGRGFVPLDPLLGVIVEKRPPRAESTVAGEKSAEAKLVQEKSAVGTPAEGQPIEEQLAKTDLISDERLSAPVAPLTAEQGNGTALAAQTGQPEIFYGTEDSAEPVSSNRNLAF